MLRVIMGKPEVESYWIAMLYRLSVPGIESGLWGVGTG